MKILKVTYTALYLYFTNWGKKVDLNGQKVVYLNTSNCYSRYLYCLIKCLELSGYQICIRPKVTLLAELLGSSYTDLLIKEGAHIGIPTNHSELVLLDDTILKREYFQSFLLGECSTESYRLPMTMHPLIYHLGKWDEPIEETTRIKSLIFLGNFDPSKYDNTLLKKIFKVETRLEVYNLLVNKPFFKKVKSNECFFGPDSHGKVILTPTTDVCIGITEIRTHLSKFEFFFALSGDKTPLCHNLIEAMSVRTIPFIEQNYARLFNHPLEDGINAIIYSGRKDMLDKIPQVLMMNQLQVVKLRKGVKEYYNKHLTPQAISNNIINKSYKRIYLQSGHKGLSPLYKQYQ